MKTKILFVLVLLTVLSGTTFSLRDPPKKCFEPFDIDTIPPNAPYLGFPTYNAGNTYYDVQHFSSNGRTIAVDTAGGVHVCWYDWETATGSTHHIKYNYFHPDSIGSTFTGWLFDGGVQVESETYASCPNIALDEGSTVPTIVYRGSTGMSVLPTAAFDAYYYASGGMGRGNFMPPSVPPESLARPFLPAQYPKVAQIDTNIFMIATGSGYSDSGLTPPLVFYRGYIDPSFGGISEMTFEPPVLIEDEVFIYPAAVIAAFDGAGTGDEIAIVYIRPDTVVRNDPLYCDNEGYWTSIFDAQAIMFRTSSDMGASWAEAETVTTPMLHIYSDYPETLIRLDRLGVGDTVPVYWRPYMLSATYSPDGDLHIAWESLILGPHEGFEHSEACSAGAYLQTVIHHWNSATGEIDTAFNAYFPYPIMWDFSMDYLPSVKPQIAIDDSNNVFVFWEQYYSEYIWSSTDTVYLDFSMEGYPSAEIYCAVYNNSLGIWSDPLNITNTYAPGCSLDCLSEIEFTVAERIDENVHLFFEVDHNSGKSWDYYHTFTNNDMVYLPIPKDSLMNFLFSDVPEFSHNPEIPAKFRLGRNWPNPFNSATAFYFDVYAAGHFNIDVVDVTGRVVSRIVSGDLKQGRHTFVWHGESGSGIELPSGTYLLRARGNGESYSRKIVLVK